MDKLASIETSINNLRDEMIRAYEKVGDLGDKTVIALSQQLDKHLLQFQLCNRDNQCGDE